VPVGWRQRLEELNRDIDSRHILSAIRGARSGLLRACGAEGGDMQTLRTAEERFVGLPGYAFEPHYADIGPLRMHYLDEGAKAAPVAFCLHGQPTWAYLYRKMIPALLAAGYRVVAPDFFGFGRSDKPVDEHVYTFDFHRSSIVALIEALGLRRVMLVCQDWGGLIGLTIPMDMPGRFERLLVMNTMLGTGDVPLSDGFVAWRAFSNRSPDMDIPALMKRAVPGIVDEEAAAYAAPFPDARYKGGVRRFPNLVPDRPDADGAALSRRARDFWSKEWTGESFMAVGMKDQVPGPPVMKALRQVIRNCPPPLELPEAGHFVQEAGEVIVAEAMKSFG
jgi:haloalkane dehalogenase